MNWILPEKARGSWCSMWTIHSLVSFFFCLCSIRFPPRHYLTSSHIISMVLLSFTDYMFCSVSNDCHNAFAKLKSITACQHIISLTTLEHSEFILFVFRSQVMCRNGSGADETIPSWVSDISLRGLRYRHLVCVSFLSFIKGVCRERFTSDVPVVFITDLIA